MQTEKKKTKDLRKYLETAVADFYQVLQYDPKDHVTKLRIADAYVLLQQYDDAMAQINQCLEWKEDLPPEV